MNIRNRKFSGIGELPQKFSPHLAKFTKPLWDLMSKDNEFTLTPQQEEAFENINSNSTVLKYFNSKTPITLQVDASTTGLGAALLQDQILVVFTRKTLTGPET